jgi:hypothetical protein
MAKNDVFSMVGGLGGDFYKDIYVTKLFGIHSRSVSSCLNAGNANTELKMSIIPICRAGNGYVHRVKRVVFSLFGGLGGDLYKGTYEAKLFGMHGGRFSLTWTSHGSQPFRR